ncbi:hypothetical protein HUJ04_011250 [Dendroctonus ponderosae]|nr:hypothetical protein HUJ04_011250 [Dendroctonus ponderosae]
MSTAVMDETSGRNSDRPRLQRTENISKCNLTGRESLHSLQPFLHLPDLLEDVLSQKKPWKYLKCVSFYAITGSKTSTAPNEGSIAVDL